MKRSKKEFYKLLITGIAFLVILVITIIIIHAVKAHHLKVAGQKKEKIFNAGPIVKAFKAISTNAGKELSLVGEARPYADATLYAQISGYLQKIKVDKGDQVRQNDTLAYIDNPQIDQQLNAAEADLTNKQKILARDKELLKNQHISQEQEDNSETNVETAQATLISLKRQQDYKTIIAPFDGTITDRYVDLGALIQSAVGSQTSSQPVVTIATLNKLRIYTYVDQKDAGFLRNGFPVEISTVDNPDIRIKGSITRYAGQLDVHTRMMLVEIDIDNLNNLIIPGSYVTVHIKAPPNSESKIQIPSNGLVIHKDKTMVAIIDKDTTIHYRPVTIGFNNGDSVTLLKGLKAGETIALSVGENFMEGQKVRIQKSSGKDKGDQNGNGSQNGSDSTGGKNSNAQSQGNNGNKGNNGKNTKEDKKEKKMMTKQKEDQSK